MGTEYHHVPSNCKLIDRNLKENDIDDLDQLVSGDYRDITRTNPINNNNNNNNKQKIKINEYELKEININKKNNEINNTTNNYENNKVKRRNRTSSFNHNHRQISYDNSNYNNKTNVKSNNQYDFCRTNDKSFSNNNLKQQDTKSIDLNDFKTSFIKIFSNVSKQKLSPASSTNLKQTNEPKKRKKRSYSHSLSSNTNNKATNQEEYYDDHDENDYIEGFYSNGLFKENDEDHEDDVDEEEYDDDDNLNYQDNEKLTRKPLLLNRSISHNENRNQKMNIIDKSFEDLMFKKEKFSNINVQELIKSSTNSTESSTDSTKTYLPSSESNLSNLNNHNVKYIISNEKLNNLDENNNNNMNDDFNIIIMDNKCLNANKSIQIHNQVKRVDSIRMRHNSNLSTNQNLNSNNNNNLKKNDNKSNGVYKTKNRTQKAHNILVIIILCVVNLLNYIDRYTVAGVILEIQEYFNISDSQSGLIQTVFICTYMLFAPLFGYLGDRYSRKWIIVFGISFWSLMTLVGSFVPPDMFWLFVLIRSLVGIGEASYSCVAPTIIGDLFADELRTKMLGVFYLAVPVGSGLGYIIGSNVADWLDSWKWAMRVTPPLGLVCIILLIIFVKEPKRGVADGTSFDGNKTSIVQDVIYLIKNKTFMWVTFGFTFASFVLGGLSWWVPPFVTYAIYSKHEIPNQIELIFGVVTCFAGLIGVVLSSLISTKLREKTKQADPLICALGSLIAVPTLFVLVLTTREINSVLFWFIAATAITGMCLSWTLVADILLYAVYPNRRSIASAMNILISHLLGDAFSPYVIGAISDALKKGKIDTYYTKYQSLQVALYAGPFFAALSFGAYLFAAIYVDEDRRRVDDYVKKCQKSNERPSSSSSINDSNILETNQSQDDLKNLDNQLDPTPSSGLTVNRQNSNTATTVLTNVYSNPLLINESVKDINNEIEVRPTNGEKNSSNYSNEIPVIFDSSINLLNSSTQSTLNS